MITDKDGKPGLRLETAASVLARDAIQKHLLAFALVIRHDRTAALSTCTEYANGLAGVISLAVAGGFGSRDEILDMTIKQLREFVARDLAHIAMN
jgi:hypothetical protein